MKRLTLFFTYIFLSVVQLQAQETAFSLNQIIQLAQDNSLEAKKAKNRQENSYWSYQWSKSVLKPSLNLSGVLPDFNNAILPIQQPDGTKQFKEVSNLYNNLGLSLNQNILWTGGSVYLRSDIERFDILGGENENTSYAGTPLIFGFSQPLFAFNPFKWQKKIEPIRFEESKKAYSEDYEQISLETTRRYFLLLLAQINLKIAQQNLKNNQQVYKIGQGRYNLGKIAENELLQLELNVLSAERDVADASLKVETSRLSLNSYVGLPKSEEYSLLLPEDLPELDIDVDIAIEQAKANRKQFLSFERRSLEAKRDVARAKRENSFNVTVNGSIGLTNQAALPEGLYQNPQNQQRVNLGVNIPILDWNRRNSKVKSALANQRLIQNTINQEEQVFEEEIYSIAKQLPILKALVKSTGRGDEIASRRYKISQERYLVANISVTDLNLALQEKDSSKRTYLNALRDYWTTYFRFRMLTMYDFRKGEPIQY